MHVAAHVARACIVVQGQSMFEGACALQQEHMQLAQKVAVPASIMLKSLGIMALG
jgi:hypothetical protein